MQPRNCVAQASTRQSVPPMSRPPPALQASASNALIVHPSLGGDAAGDEAVALAWYYESSQAADMAEKSGSGHVGLSNQGATCYLNSCLQSLFMTPEFREMIYRWRYRGEEVDGPKEECIAYQLQLLFARLAMSEKHQVETRELTKSFGWNAAASFQQHDVQELLRVLFDALEDAFRGHGDLEQRLSTLYQGELEDYIQGVACGHRRVRSDPFLDVQLVVRQTPSLHVAMRKFVEAEVLDGGNKWQCERCDDKVDARKGLMFRTFPYILTLHLRRFDFDMELRVKLNSTFVFPGELDSSDFIGPPPETPETPEAETEPETGQVGAGMLTAAMDKEKRTTALAAGTLYELYAVLVHSGGAMGGHYYTYIRSFANREWYKFNDSQVTLVTVDEVESSFGGKSTISSNMRAANAYMLLYRRVEPSANICTVPMELLPPEVVELVKKENEDHEAAKKKYAKTKDRMKLLVTYLPAPVEGQAVDASRTVVSSSVRPKSVEKYIHVHRTTTLAEATRIAYDVLVLGKAQADPAKKSVDKGTSTGDDSKGEQASKEGAVNEETAKKEVTADGEASKEPATEEPEVLWPPVLWESPEDEAKAIAEAPFSPDCCRLRMYNIHRHIPGEVFPDPSRTLGDLKFSESRYLLLEWKEQNAEFPPWNPDNMQLRVVLVDAVERKATKAYDVFVKRKEETVGGLKEAIEAATGIPATHQRVMEIIHNSTQLLYVPANLLYRDHRILEGDLLYLERVSQEADASTMEGSVAIDMYQFEQNFVEVSYNIPGKHVLNQTIRVDRRKTVKQLREAIALKLGNITADEFKVRRGTKSATELKDSAKTLADHYISTGSVLYLELGTPLAADDYNFCFHIYNPAHVGGGCTREVVQLCLSQNLTVLEAKQKVHEALSNMGPLAYPWGWESQGKGKEKAEESADPPPGTVPAAAEALAAKGPAPALPPIEQMRFRDRTAQRVGKMLFDKKTIKESFSYMFDGRDIAVQWLDGPERAVEGGTLLSFQAWDPQEQRLGPRLDAPVDDEMGFLDFLRQLCEAAGLEADSILNLAVCKPSTPLLIDPIQLKLVTWQKAKSESDDRKLKDVLWCITDGDVVVFKALPHGEGASTEGKGAAVVGGGDEGGRVTTGKRRADGQMVPDARQRPVVRRAEPVLRIKRRERKSPEGGGEEQKEGEKS